LQSRKALKKIVASKATLAGQTTLPPTKAELALWEAAVAQQEL